MIADVVAPRKIEAFVWKKEPRTEWVTRLHDMSPMSDHQTGLVIAWEPGDPWEPVQRWFLYELYPKSATHPAILRELEGPHPRSSGHGCFGTNEYGTWCSCPKPAYRWIGGPAPLITRQAWELYRKYGGYARPLWVIQGKGGGHKYRFVNWESRLSAMSGGPKQPPPAGDLPYAEPDERTWEGIRLYADPELMKAYSGLVKYGMRRPFDLDAADRRAAEFAATEILKGFGLRVAEHADELSWALKNAGGIDGPDEHERDRDDPERDEASTYADLTHMLATST